MDWTGPGSARRADLLRGIGYALTAWPIALVSFGVPGLWLRVLAAVGIVVLGVGLWAEWLAGRMPAFMLTKRQSAAFVAATVTLWLAVAASGALSGEGEPGTSCVEHQQLVAIGGTNVTVELRVPDGVDGVLARFGGFANGSAPFAAAAGTNYLRILAVEGVSFRVEVRVGGAWRDAGGGGIENGAHGFGFDEDFAADTLRVTATAAASRDGTTERADIRFERLDRSMVCTTR